MTSDVTSPGAWNVLSAPGVHRAARVLPGGLPTNHPRLPAKATPAIGWEAWSGCQSANELQDISGLGQLWLHLSGHQVCEGFDKSLDGRGHIFDPTLAAVPLPHADPHEDTASATRRGKSPEMNQGGAQIPRGWLAPFGLWPWIKGKVETQRERGRDRRTQRK